MRTNPLPSIDVFIDGASQGNPGPAGIGVVIVNGHGAPLAELSKSIGQATNNVAEYLALIYALGLAQQHRLEYVRIKSDSELLVRQLNGQYKVREAHLRVFHDIARHLLSGFPQATIEHIPRTDNTRADRLASQAASAAVRVVTTQRGPR